MKLELPKVCVVKSFENFIDIIQKGGCNFREYTIGGKFIPHMVMVSDNTFSINGSELSKEDLETRFSSLIAKSKIVKFN